MTTPYGDNVRMSKENDGLAWLAAIASVFAGKFNKAGRKG